jgi:hypothetical protein
LDGKRLHFATCRRHLRARCNSAGARANGAFTVEQYDRNEELLRRLHRIEGALALGNGEGRTG